MFKNILHALRLRKKIADGPTILTSYVVSTEKAKEIRQKLVDHNEEFRPFLISRYSIRDLSQNLQIPVYQLSAFFNQHMDMNFNEYLNRLRIQHCLELIKSGITENLNLKGIAAASGFNNRNTFTTAFKKFTGRTPSTYTKVTGSIGAQYEFYN